MKSFSLLPRVLRVPIGRNAIANPELPTTGARSWRVGAHPRPYSTDRPRVKSILQPPNNHSIKNAAPKLSAAAEAGANTTPSPPPTEADTTLQEAGADGKRRKNEKNIAREPKNSVHLDPNGARVFNMNPIEFRKLMSQVPQPVVVISSLQLPPLAVSTQPIGRRSLSEKETKEATPAPKALLPEAECTIPIPRAMTVSSFTSLSLDPLTSVTFNINLPSHTYEAIATSHRFNVHVLLDNEDGARLARRFAQAGYSRLDEKPAPEDEKPGAAFARDLDLQVMGTPTWESEWAQRVEEYQADRNCSATRKWLPLSSEAMPVLVNPGILYTLRCVVRPPRETNAINRGSGLIQLDEGNVIVVGDVQDCVMHHTHGLEWCVPHNDIALSYVQKQYRMAGVPRKLLDSAPHVSKQ